MNLTSLAIDAAIAPCFAMCSLHRASPTLKYRKSRLETADNFEIKV